MFYSVALNMYFVICWHIHIPVVSCICVDKTLITYLALESFNTFGVIVPRALFLCITPFCTGVDSSLANHVHLSVSCQFMFRHFAGNMCTTNVHSAFLCRLSWRRPGEKKCDWTGSIPGEVAKGGTKTCAMCMGVVAGKVPRIANIIGSGLMIWFFLLFAVRGSMQYLRRNMYELGRSWSKDKQGICILNQSSLMQSGGVLTWTHWVTMPSIFHIPFERG